MWHKGFKYRREEVDKNYPQPSPIRQASFQQTMEYSAVCPPSIIKIIIKVYFSCIDRVSCFSSWFMIISSIPSEKGHQYCRGRINMLDKIDNEGTRASLKSLVLRKLLTFGYLTYPYLSLPFLTFPYLSLPFLTVPCLPTESWVLNLTGPYLALLSLT